VTIFATFTQVKKFTAILFCSIACVIQFAHSAVPHSHAEEHHHGQHSHHHQHDHDNSSDTEGKTLVPFFSHFGHSAETFTNHQTEDIKISQHDAFQPAFVEHQSSVIEGLAVESKIPKKAFDEPYIYISPHLLSLQFRGPPAA
jgi:hypothetical protein